MKKRSASVAAVVFVALIFLPAPARPARTITVLTYNVYDAFFSPDREERIPLMPGAIMELGPVPDVIVFEEAFNKEHRRELVAGLSALGYEIETAHYWKKHYGTGIMVVSRFPMVSGGYTFFRVDGDFYDPEKYSGKGVGHCLLETPYGAVDLFATHPISRFKPLYDEEGNHIDRDRRTIDRLLEMESAARIIEQKKRPGARSLIFAGDLNASPDMWSYQYLIKRARLSDPFFELHPGEYQSTYTPENTLCMVDFDQSRIDHVLYRNMEGDQGFWLRPLQCDIVLKRKINLSDGKVSNISDHYGVLAVFEVVKGPEDVQLPREVELMETQGKRDRADLVEEGIKLTPQNYRAWQEWAIQALDRADKRYNRYSLRVIPAARIVIAGRVTQPVTVPLSPLQRSSISRDLLMEALH